VAYFALNFVAIFVKHAHELQEFEGHTNTESLPQPEWHLALCNCFVPVKTNKQTNKQIPWSESASELYRPSDRRFSAKWLPTFADKGCHVVNVMDPYGRILGFLDRSRYFSIK
jgi:hypothetical protein